MGLRRGPSLRTGDLVSHENILVAMHTYPRCNGYQRRVARVQAALEGCKSGLPRSPADGGLWPYAYLRPP